MPRPPLNNFLSSNKQAIVLINPPAMEELSYKRVYGGIIPVRTRRTLMWLATYITAYQRHCPAGILQGYLIEASKISRMTAIEDLKDAVSFGMISSYQEGTSTLYYLPMNHNLGRLVILLEKIRDVVAAQVADPLNGDAGIELFEADDKEVYFNIVRQIMEKKNA